MNKVIENIPARRSHRFFGNKKIPDKNLNEILQAGANAPSAMYRQVWMFTLLTNHEMLQELAKAAEKALGQKGLSYVFAKGVGYFVHATPLLAIEERPPDWTPRREVL